MDAEQENCSHPAWVLLNKESDPYEGRVYDIARGFPNDRVIFDAPSIYMNAKWNEFFEKCFDEYFSP